MAIFRINKLSVVKLLSKSFDLEQDLQKIFENNLEEILNVVFLAHEYSTSFGGRIDTLGVDKNGSPCIIEYKKNQNDNVINQGLSYLRWILDHKPDFEILCQKKNIHIEIDWDSPRVICVAENYSKFDIDTADVLPIKIDLLRYRVYDENILYVEAENYQKIKISTSGIIKKSKREKDKCERFQKIYSIEDHLEKINKYAKDLFLSLREHILSMDGSIMEEPKKKYIAYKTSTNFVDVVVKQYGLKIFLNVKSGFLNDAKKLARDLTKPKIIGHWGNGDYEIKLEKKEDLEDVFFLIKQSYNLNK